MSKILMDRPRATIQIDCRGCGGAGVLSGDAVGCCLEHTTEDSVCVSCGGLGTKEVAPDVICAAIMQIWQHDRGDGPALPPVEWLVEGSLSDESWKDLEVAIGSWELVRKRLALGESTAKHR